MFRQGLHVKTCSIITDEHVQGIFMAELREMKDEHRTPDTFQRLCNEILFKKIPNAPEKISLSTAARWLKFLGYNPRVQQKGYYTDGHNRTDVVEYRDNIFLPRMLSYERRMQEYSGDNMEVIIPPELSDGERRVVLITHDESTFYCNEGKPLMWMENGKNKLLPKCKGTSLMVSGFCCDCHGFFNNGVQKSYTTFEAGIAREGWFTNKDLVAQFDKIIPMIKDLHPACDILIAFDNSMTHHAKVFN
jgi:hypothetical protein